jgi:uncharacterized protein YbaR (Trm112 family)
MGRPEDYPTRLVHWEFAMAISKELNQLLDILVCPVCKAVVEVKADESGLKCVQCHRVYPIRDEIPVMLVDEAKIEE